MSFKCSSAHNFEPRFHVLETRGCEVISKKYIGDICMRCGEWVRFREDDSFGVKDRIKKVLFTAMTDAWHCGFKSDSSDSMLDKGLFYNVHEPYEKASRAIDEILKEQ